MTPPMSLRQLLGLSAAAGSGRSLSTAGLRRPLSTAAASSQHPPWAVIHPMSMVDRSSSAPGACFRPVDPPGLSHIYAPARLIDPTEGPNAGGSSKVQYLAGNVVQLLYGKVGAASGDGHLLLSYHQLRSEGPCTVSDLIGNTETQRFVCNPLTGQMLRLPDVGGSRRTLAYHHMGLLTQADAGLGNGPPERFAVADIVFNGAALARFLSEEGKWAVLPVNGTAPLPRPMQMNQETVSFGGRLWWVDLKFGAVSVDPFADRPEIRFLDLPSGSVMPPRARTDDGDLRKVDERAVELGLYMREVAKHRRIGVSEGRLRYAEVTTGGPCLLSSYSLNDDEGSGWTLEHQVALKQVLADGGYPWQENSAPQIVVLDPLNASAMYLKVGKHVVAVDMHNGKVIASGSPLQDKDHSLVPCVLPPWLGSSRIPTPGTGKKDGMEVTDDLVSSA